MRKSGVTVVVVLVILVSFGSFVLAENELELDGKLTQWIYNSDSSSNRVDNADDWEWVCENLYLEGYDNWIKPNEEELEIFFGEYPDLENNPGLFCYRFYYDSGGVVEEDKAERGFFGNIWNWFIGLFGYGDSDPEGSGVNVPELEDNPDCPQEKEFLEGLYIELEVSSGNKYECIRTCITVAKGGLNEEMLRTLEFGQNLMAIEGEKTCDDYGYTTDYCNVCDYDLGSVDSEYEGALGNTEGFAAAMKEFNKEMGG
jgi:hypothetical protein